MKVVLPAPDISRAIVRIAHEILERYNGADSITLLGIPTRGAHLANRVAAANAAVREVAGTRARVQRWPQTVAGWTGS